MRVRVCWKIGSCRHSRSMLFIGSGRRVSTKRMLEDADKKLD